LNLLAELRKRNVFRVLAAYLVGSWIVMQVIGFVADAAELPGWIDSFILIVVLLGLPIVGIAAWALELTPDGIKTSGTETELAPRPIGPVDYVLMAAVVVVLGLFGWQTFSQPLEVQVAIVEPAVEEATEEQLQPQSIAVLPFVAISEAPEDVVLGDGLAEELLNVLAQFPDLAVAGRTSSFSFRDRAEDITAIGEALGVNHVLEGSVRRSGDQIRVTAQLIRVADGFHIWSGNYDRPFTDILEVQDEIVRQIAQVLTIRLGASAYEAENIRAANAAAYEQYLRGRVLWAERHDIANRNAAIDAFQTAVDIDPNFADGWAALGRSLAYSATPDGYTDEEKLERIGQATERALALDSNNAEAMVALSNLNLERREWRIAKENTDRAIEIAPNAAFTHYNAVIVYEYLGDREMIARSARRAMALDPLNITIQDNAIQRYTRMGRFGEARRLLESSQLSNDAKGILLGSIASYNRDADGLSEVYVRQRELLGAQLPNSEEHLLALDNFVFAMVAAFQNDEEEVRERLLVVEASYETFFIDPSGAAQLLYLIGDYAEAARGYREYYETSGSFDVTNHFAINLPFDEGLRCQPDYHAIWNLPEWAGLAEIRRANGATGNLPLSGSECDAFLEVAE